MEVYFYNYENTSFLNGYKLGETDIKYYNLRTTLYGYYMTLTMIVEYPYRDYKDKQP